LCATALTVIRRRFTLQSLITEGGIEMANIRIEAAVRMRKRLGLKQDAFWNRLGVTQSAGSRYETQSRALPHTIGMLIELIYGSKPANALKRLRA
jgi:DNA-binding transcriptional regulator YiaG